MLVVSKKKCITFDESKWTTCTTISEAASQSPLMVTTEYDDENTYAEFTALPESEYELKFLESSEVYSTKLGTVSQELETRDLIVDGNRQLFHIDCALPITSCPYWWDCDVPWPPSVSFLRSFACTHVENTLFANKLSSFSKLRYKMSWTDIFEYDSNKKIWYILKEDLSPLMNLQGKYDIRALKSMSVPFLRKMIDGLKKDERSIARMIFRLERRKRIDVRCVRALWLRSILDHINTFHVNSTFALHQVALRNASNRNLRRSSTPSSAL